MPEMNRAAPDGNRKAAQEDQRERILALQHSLGNCASCGVHIRLVGGATTCPTCAAWHRWYSSFRLASKYLREVPR